MSISTGEQELSLLPRQLLKRIGAEVDFFALWSAPFDCMSILFNANGLEKFRIAQQGVHFPDSKQMPEINDALVSVVPNDL